MYHLKAFDYDLWTTEEYSKKKYWVRVKETKEVSEITHEVMKYLRCEEKRIRREIDVTDIRNSVDLSYDTTPTDNQDSIWLQDSTNIEDDCITKQLINEFRNLLTPTQLIIFNECLYGGKSQTEFATEHGVKKQSVGDSIKLIRKKAKNFFIDT